MPPVLGPVSPSPMRLWSWAIGSGRATVPSQSAIRLHSGPERHSSTTIGPAAASVAIAATVSSSPAGTMTPLPAARPSCLTTTGAPSACHHANASTAEVVARWRGEGSASRSAIWRAWPFDDSSLATSAVGPKHGIPRRLQSSATPLASAVSGPTITRSADASAARSAVTVTSWPWLRQAQAIADSRPPPPITSTLTSQSQRSKPRMVCSV